MRNWRNSERHVKPSADRPRPWPRDGNDERRGCSCERPSRKESWGLLPREMATPDRPNCRRFRRCRDRACSSNSWLPRLQRSTSLPSYENSAPSANVGPGSGAGPGSSDCGEEPPTCRQVASTIEMRTASLQAHLDAGGLDMTGLAELNAELAKVILDHMPACVVTVTRPRCRTALQEQVESWRKYYQSAPENARRYRGEL